MYKNSPISPDTKWPPTPSREFISLTVVKGGHKCRDDYIGHTLLGNITEILEKRKEISTEQILEAEKGQNKLRLILIEGAPGIGKSTLAWELCRKWEEFSCMQQYKLVVLLRLREKELQNITDVSNLFVSHERETLAKEVSDSQGRGILFILDGFDELPKKLQEEGFLLDLIKGIVLPESTVLVTSRPSATGELFTSCRPQIQKHVEVLGFTQQSVQAYASSIFSSEPENLERFIAYISASDNPAINSLMYVPLNAAIVIEVFRDCKSDKLLPHTLTELYTQLCLTILNRYLKIHYPSVVAEKFEDLPPGLYQQFLHLSEMAFEGVEESKIIFHGNTSTLNHFGFLDAVPALYGGGRISYNFLHLTVQEFFAAYHISNLDNSGLEVFRKHGKNQQWNTVWRFVAGLTKFRDYDGHFEKDIFIQEGVVSLFLFQCLFEAQTVEHFSTCLSLSATATVKALFPSSMDAYALGYCIANFPMGVPWDVLLRGNVHHSFTCGLQTNTPNVGVIKKLGILECPVRFAELESNPICQLNKLELSSCQLTNADMVHFSELIPKLTSLNVLYISNNCFTGGQQDGLLKVLHQLYHSNVTTLAISNIGLGELLNSPHDYSSAIKCLIDPSSGKLGYLGIGESKNNLVDSLLVDLLSAPSSLKFLSLCISCLSLHVEYLKNTRLGGLQLSHWDLSSQVPYLVDIVTHNKTLRTLYIQELTINTVRPLVCAIHGNKTLQNIILRIKGLRDSASEYMTTHHRDLTLDTRIRW